MDVAHALMLTSRSSISDVGGFTVGVMSLCIQESPKEMVLESRSMRALGRRFPDLTQSTVIQTVQSYCCSSSMVLIVCI